MPELRLKLGRSSAGFLLISEATCMLLAGPSRNWHLKGEAAMDSSALTGLAFFLFVTGVLIYTVILYNGLVRLRNENDRAWANIDVLLKQRHDEIPNLVETVKGYMQHEQQTLLAVTEARSASMGAASIGQKAVADLQVTSALRGLFAVAENYPQLKANQNFLKLQTRITELEERIADRREFFNDDVNTYNTRIGQIPEVFVASFMGLKRREMFKVSDEDRKLVDVKFASGQGSGA
ncbi:MAG TPA: LemA family protein [Candidatus Sulfotelmatobacter sp.]